MLTCKVGELDAVSSFVTSVELHIQALKVSTVSVTQPTLKAVYTTQRSFRSTRVPFDSVRGDLCFLFSAQRHALDQTIACGDFGDRLGEDGKL
jgi:hypothetical protein